MRQWLATVRFDYSDFLLSLVTRSRDFETLDHQYHLYCNWINPLVFSAFDPPLDPWFTLSWETSISLLDALLSLISFARILGVGHGRTSLFIKFISFAWAFTASERITFVLFLHSQAGVQPYLAFLSSLETFLLFTTTPYNPLPIHVMSRFRGVNIDCPLTSLHLSMSFLLPPTFAFIPIRFFLPLLGFILGYFHIFFLFSILFPPFPEWQSIWFFFTFIWRLYDRHTVPLQLPGDQINDPR